MRQPCAALDRTAAEIAELVQGDPELQRDEGALEPEGRWGADANIATSSTRPMPPFYRLWPRGSRP